MTKKVRRNIIKNIFINFEKEETWLNKMCKQGYALQEISNRYYIFELCEPGEYIYRIEFLKQETMNKHEKTDYRNFMKEMDVDLIASFNRWQYYRKDAALGEFEVYSDIDSKIKHYQRINFIWYSLAVIFIIAGSEIITDLILGNIGKSSLIFDIPFLVIGLFFLVLALPFTKKIRDLKVNKKLFE